MDSRRTDLTHESQVSDKLSSQESNADNNDNGNAQQAVTSQPQISKRMLHKKINFNYHPILEYIATPPAPTAT